MHRSLAVILVAAVSCVSAFPVVFLTYKDGESSKGERRILNCVSPIPFLDPKSYGLSYRCRPSSQNAESLDLKSSDLPIFEILEEPQIDITSIEVEEVDVPARNSLFQSSRIVVQTNDATNANTKYDIVPEGRTGKRNRGGCEDDEVFVAELDMCMPYSPVHSAPKTASINNDQEPIAVAPSHTITKVGQFKVECGEGMILQPSIGICVHIDNCYPCDEDKDKDKKPKERKAEEEDDD